MRGAWDAGDPEVGSWGRLSRSQGRRISKQRGAGQTRANGWADARRRDPCCRAKRPQEFKLTRTITIDGEAQSFIQTFALDGRESVNPLLRGEGESKSKASWNNHKLVIEGTQKVAMPNGEMEMGYREEFSLADDGRSLVLKTTRSTPKGQMSMKQVFTKQ
jgi:hypothetical protein